MSTSSSVNKGFPLPDATMSGKRLQDIQAVKAALVAIDAAIATGGSGGGSSIDANTDLVVKSVTVSGSILPTVSGTQDIGSPSKRFKGIYVDEAHLSVNTLYLGDTAILGTTADTVRIHSDPNQSISIATSGTGASTVSSERSVLISTSGLNADVLVQANGAGSQVRLGSPIAIQLTTPDVYTSGNQSIAGNQSVAGNLTVTGSVTLNGSVVNVNSTTVTTKDNIIELNKGQVGSGVSAGYSGISVDRGDLPAYQMLFNEAIDMFQVGMAGSLETVSSQNYVQSYAAPVVHTHTAATTSVAGFMSGADKTKVDNIASDIATAKTAATADAVAASAPVSHVGSYGAAHAVVTSANAGFMSAADKVKLDTIATGAQANVIVSVNGKSDSAVILTPTDIGLGNVDNTGDSAKPVSTAQALAIATAQTNAQNASAPVAHVGSGGTAHANAVSGGAAGFMTGTDKAKLDTLTKNLPQVIKSVDYTLTAADDGGHVLHPASDATARTYTIPSNANVPYVIGTALTFICQNGAGNVNIAIAGTDILRNNTGATGTRVLAPNGMATAVKITATEWLINGSNLT